MRLSKTGRRFSNCDSAIDSSGVCVSCGLDGEPDVCMFLRLLCLGRCRWLINEIHGHLWKNKAKTHCQDDHRSIHTISNGRLKQLQCCLRPLGDLHKAAGHPEEEYAWH